MLTVAVTGGAGRLGALITTELATRRWEVRVLDREPPYARTTLAASDVAPAEFWRVDVEQADQVRKAVRGCDAVVHLAGLHGAHLAAGAPRDAIWRANVRGTATVVDACVREGVRRVVLASSTSVYGPGTPPGEHARVLDEDTDVAPDDVYDLSKLVAERIVLGARRAGGIEAVALRLGRFFFGTVENYHLRKLSTGLDVHDAAQAVYLALVAGMLPSKVYCVASDLPLARAERRALGLDAPAVVASYAPHVAEELRHRGWRLPNRVGKSVDSTRIRRELGYVPVRHLAWWASRLRRARTSTRDHERDALRHAPGHVLSESVPPAERSRDLSGMR
ncbi:MAG TPA: NAD(P)-dependent oxidoreductase [Actinomycetota bacterium]|nr:NAD(P)-dependent oxidoreductase [Actinomycetota bacterium]